MANEAVKRYVYSVARDIYKGKWDTPEQSNLPTDIIEQILKKIESDEKALKSLYRDLDSLWEDDFNKLIKFGEYKITDGSYPEGTYGTGASRRTIAYKKTKELLESDLKLIRRRKTGKGNKKSSINESDTDIDMKHIITSVIGVIALFVILIFMAQSC